MGILAKLFGQCGTIRYEGTTYDGRPFTGKCKIEAFNMDTKEIEEWLKNACYVETGIKCSEIKIVGFSQE